MSFSSVIKKELFELPIKAPCCAAAELAAFARFWGVKKKDALVFKTGSAQGAARLRELCEKAFGLYIPIDIVGKMKRYTLRLDDARALERLFAPEDELTEDPCCKRAFVRGAFLAGGSVSAPEKNYHLEISFSDGLLLEKTARMFARFDLSPKTTARKGALVLYFKSSRAVSDTLNVMGAHKAMMALLETKIEKERKNAVNRSINCESANMDKTVEASILQRRAIQKLIKRLDSLPGELRETAVLRLENAELSLKALGELHDPPINKSAVARRMKKIMEMAQEVG